MAAFTITFETDPMTNGPWQGRESAKRKMIQSITDYLTQRCGCTNVSFVKDVVTPAVVEVVPKKVATGRKRF